MPLHDIAGAILASAAVVLSIYVFKRTLDFQAYKIDSDYMEVLKIGLENPDFRNREWTNNYTENKGSGKDRKKILQYEQYAFMVWNVIETIFDRKTIDKTWIPVINLEKELHYEWFKQNGDKFKPQFRDYIDGGHPRAMRIAAARP